MAYIAFAFGDLMKERVLARFNKDELAVRGPNNGSGRYDILDEKGGVIGCVYQGRWRNQPGDVLVAVRSDQIPLIKDFGARVGLHYANCRVDGEKLPEPQEVDNLLGYLLKVYNAKLPSSGN